MNCTLMKLFVYLLQLLYFDRPPLLTKSFPKYVIDNIQIIFFLFTNRIKFKITGKIDKQFSLYILLT